MYVYCHHDGEGEKTVDIFYMDADKKRDFLLYLNRIEDTDLMCVLDSGSAVNVLTNKLLFDEDIRMNEGINIRNSSGKYRINKSGNAMPLLVRSEPIYQYPLRVPMSVKQQFGNNKYLQTRWSQNWIRREDQKYGC